MTPSSICTFRRSFQPVDRHGCVDAGETRGRATLAWIDATRERVAGWDDAS